ncbi:MAG: hypothetical protein K2K58_06715 [Muribaculaceae bacterium]|nr:hypothetical protein [Muribaculaceae bacterium]
MSNKHFDIEDDEIRIISPKGKSLRKRVSKKTRRIIAGFIVPVIIILLIMTIWLIARSGSDSKPVSPVGNNTENQASAIPPQSAIPIKKSDAFCIVKDTIVNDTPLRIITPRNAIPTLEVGYQPSADSTAVLAALAADVRGDNGMIAGAFVLKGNFLVKGKPKPDSAQ